MPPQDIHPVSDPTGRKVLKSTVNCDELITTKLIQLSFRTLQLFHGIPFGKPIIRRQTINENELEHNPAPS